LPSLCSARRTSEKYGNVTPRNRRKKKREREGRERGEREREREKKNKTQGHYYIHNDPPAHLVDLTICSTNTNGTYTRTIINS
tara:strand:- start:7 stop:255 length:249 start_codon:yes stop_codon:yes gene_type:complete